MEQQTTWPLPIVTLPSLLRSSPRTTIIYRDLYCGGLCFDLNFSGLNASMMLSTDNFTRSTDVSGSNSGDASLRAPTPKSSITSWTGSASTTQIRGTPTTFRDPLSTSPSTQPTNPLPDESSTVRINPSPSVPTFFHTSDGPPPNFTQATGLVNTTPTGLISGISTTSGTWSLLTLTTTVVRSVKDTDIVIVLSTNVASTTISAPLQSSTDGPPSAQTSSPTGAEEEKPPLTNGATAGIVLAVVAVLLGTFFLVRYIYKRRGFCARSQPFSPIQEPYHRPPPGPISNPIPQDPRRHSWLSHPGGQAYPSVVITPSRDESIELQTFTRPVYGPRMYDVGHSGNAPIAPPYNGHPTQEHHRPPPPSDVPAGPPAEQTAQEEPVSPESPNPAAPAPDTEGRAAPTRNRTGALPWEDGYRYRAW